MLYTTLFLLCTLISLCEAFRLVIKPPFLRPTTPLQLEFCPLIGGPKFLPVHVQVVVLDDDAKHKFDFIPQDATKPETLVRMFRLKAVPGDLRYLPPGSTITASPWVERAKEYTTTYEDPNLHLVTNNCWTFAWKLVRHLDRGQEE